MQMTSGIMIDKPDTVDRDDAIWVEPTSQRDDGQGGPPCEGWDVVVHIARVADVVPIGSETDRQAAERARTVYRPGRVTPMLPRQIEDRATLHPHIPRPTIAITFRVTPDGTVTDNGLAEAMLTRPVALDYARATAALTAPAHPQHAPLRAAHDAAHALLTRRRNHGALVLYDLQQGLITDGDGGLVHLGTSERHTAYVIVAELMVAANRAVAEIAVARDLPILFRNHQPAATAPDRDQMAEELRLATAGDPSRRDTTRERLTLLLRPATYAPFASEHYGLRLPWYTHATSPLRRYADLVVQRQLLAILRNQTPPYTSADLSTHADAINTHLDRARERREVHHDNARHNQRRTTIDKATFAGLGADEFYALIKLAVRENRHSEALLADLLDRVAADRTDPRTAHVLLATTDPVWSPARDATFAWMARHPENAISVVSMRASLAGMKAPAWDEQDVGNDQIPLFAARATIMLSGHPTSSHRRIGRSKTAARQQAALSLLAILTGADDPSTTIPVLENRAPLSHATADEALPATGRNPAMELNELAQRPILYDLQFTFAMTGPSHKPTFTCTAQARHGSTADDLTGLGSAPTKAEAKVAAAAQLRSDVDRLLAQRS